MNIAFPALIIFLLVLPGSFAQNFYHRAEKIVIDATPFGVAIARAFFWAIILNLAWAAIVNRWIVQIDFESLVTLLIGDRSPAANVDRAIHSISNNFWLPTSYFLSLYVISAALGWFARKAITNFKLDRFDRKFLGIPSPFRFPTPWYYLFSAYDKVPTPEGIVVSGVVDIAGKAFIYAGFLADYYLNDDGSLNRVVLKYAIRRPMEADLKAEAPDSNRFYEIDGDYFVLRYEEVVTLNIRYVEEISDTLDFEITETMGASDGPASPDVCDSATSPSKTLSTDREPAERD